MVLGLWLVGPGTALAKDDVTVDNLLRQGLSRLAGAERAWHDARSDDSRRLGLEAEQFFRDALSVRADLNAAILLAGQAAAFAGESQRALEWSERLARLTPYGNKDPDLLYLQAFIQLVSFKDPARAIELLDRMLAVNPNVRPVERDTLAYLALNEHGKRLLRTKRHDAAVQQFQAAARVARRLGHARKESAATGNTGIALRLADRYAEAEAIFARLKEVDPENPVWWWEMGLNYADQNRFDEAMPEYLRVIALRDAGKTNAALDDELKLAWLRLGNCLRHVGERPENLARRDAFLQRAQESILNYIKEAPTHSLGSKWLGVLLLENLQRPHEAEPHFRRAYAMDPTCDDALRYLIQIHEQHPPPAPQPATEDPAELQRIEAAWRAPVAQWKQELEAHQEQRRAERDARETSEGTDGCM